MTSDPVDPPPGETATTSDNTSEVPTDVPPPAGEDGGEVYVGVPSDGGNTDAPPETATPPSEGGGGTTTAPAGGEGRTGMASNELTTADVEKELEELGKKMLENKLKQQAKAEEIKKQEAVIVRAEADLATAGQKLRDAESRHRRLKGELSETPSDHPDRARLEKDVESARIALADAVTALYSAGEKRDQEKARLTDVKNELKVLQDEYADMMKRTNELLGLKDNRMQLQE